MIRSARINVTNAATPLVATDVGKDYREGSALLVRNRSTVSVDVGGSAVTTGTGFELSPDEDLSFRLESEEVVYAVAATAGPHRVDVLFQGV